jgi:hypothetical protein
MGLTPTSLTASRTIFTVKPAATTSDTQVAPQAANLGTASGVVAYTFYATPTTSQTNIAMTRAGHAAALSIPMPYKGSVVALALEADTAKTAGAANFTVRKNGTSTSAAFFWANNQRQNTQFSNGQITFARNDYLDVTYTTGSTYAPTTAKVEVTVYLAIDQQQ